MFEFFTVQNLEAGASILSSLSVVFGALVAWWYADSWYKQYLCTRRDKAFGEISVNFLSALQTTEELASLMHRCERITPDQATKYLDKLMTGYTECRKQWMSYQLAGATALPFVSNSSRMLFVRSNELILLLHHTFAGAVQRIKDNGPFEAAEALKHWWFPAMTATMLDLQLMIQEESSRKPKIRSHTREIVKELKAVGTIGAQRR